MARRKAFDAPAIEYEVEPGVGRAKQPIVGDEGSEADVKTVVDLAQALIDEATAALQKAAAALAPASVETADGSAERAAGPAKDAVRVSDYIDALAAGNEAVIEAFETAMLAPDGDAAALLVAGLVKTIEEAAAIKAAAATGALPADAVEPTLDIVASLRLFAADCAAAANGAVPDAAAELALYDDGGRAVAEGAVFATPSMAHDARSSLAAFVASLPGKRSYSSLLVKKPAMRAERGSLVPVVAERIAAAIDETRSDAASSIASAAASVSSAAERLAGSAAVLRSSQLIVRAAGAYAPRAAQQRVRVAYDDAADSRATAQAVYQTIEQHIVDQTIVEGVTEGDAAAISQEVFDQSWQSGHTLDAHTTLGLAAADHDHDAAYAPIGQGVTNGDAHDHAGGDGAQVDHGTLGGLADDDHPQYYDASRHTLAVHTALGLAPATHDHDSAYAPIAKGVTNGDAHDHAGGDGAQIAHGSLSGLSSDHHTQYLNSSRHSAIDHTPLIAHPAVSVQSLANSTSVSCGTANTWYTVLLDDPSPGYIVIGAVQAGDAIMVGGVARASLPSGGTYAVALAVYDGGTTVLRRFMAAGLSSNVTGTMTGAWVAPQAYSDIRVYLQVQVSVAQSPSFGSGSATGYWAMKLPAALIA